MVLLALGTSLAVYGNGLPGNVSLYSRSSGRYMGQTNVVTITGLAMLPIGAGLLLFWFLTRSKQSTKSRNSALQTEEGTAKVIGA